MIHFVDLSEGSSSSVLKKLQLSERRKQHKNGDTIKTSQRRSFMNSNITRPYFNVHLSALRFLCIVCLGMLAEFGDVLDHLKIDTKKTTSHSLHRDTHHHHHHIVSCPSNLSEGLSLILFASVLGNLLQSSSPLGPPLHFDQAGQQTDQQKENQQAQQGNDGHIQGLQFVGCREAWWEREGRTGVGE